MKNCLFDVKKLLVTKNGFWCFVFSANRQKVHFGKNKEEKRKEKTSTGVNEKRKMFLQLGGFPYILDLFSLLYFDFNYRLLKMKK